MRRLVYLANAIYLSYLSVFCPAARIPIYMPALLENYAWVPAAQGLPACCSVTTIGSPRLRNTDMVQSREKETKKRNVHEKNRTVQQRKTHAHLGHKKSSKMYRVSLRGRFSATTLPSEASGELTDLEARVSSFENTRGIFTPRHCLRLDTHNH